MSEKHYTKPYGRGSFTANEIMLRGAEPCVQAEISKGVWGMARPLPYYSFRERIVQAFHVLTLRADALYWGERE